jgi:hypothetical protein
MAIAGRVNASPPCARITVFPSTKRLTMESNPGLNLSDAAKLLHVSPNTLRLATEAGVIEAVHPLPDRPWIFSRLCSSTLTARAITEQARQKRPAGSHPDQQNLFS